MKMKKKETSDSKKYFSGKHKKALVGLLAIVAILVGVTVVWGMMRSKDNVVDVEVEQSGDFKADMVYYYGKECTHCNNIEKFIDENKVESKISFVKKEVWHDAASDMEMRARSEACALDPAKVGVPFLWARGKCYIGEVEVKKYLKKEIGME
ncbi:MAG: hypothetical protein ACD_56C00069G0002 [uncultured bacterium]|nr:MAG: hypothetical protein ACD_56C00069G0002 [uncultured bacterium]